ncbi:MAG: hypothetical protein FJ291_09705 [Planctomycetes bacterium]|nr:hypothetical protein [Planctomycetota bacterium]
MRAPALGGIAVAAAAIAAVSCRSGPQPQNDPLGPNAGCYVCHMTFLNEPLSTTHLRAGIGCVRCHGVSAAHANDENIGATKPDVVIKASEVNAFCRKCHAKHDVPPEAIVARWQARFPAGPKPPPTPTCTACHGTHKIARKP